MVDQAAELRNLVSQTSRGGHPTAGPRPRLVVFSGGKGGVGVTTLAVNVAINLVDQGLRVVLVDADLYRADVATLCQLPERGNVGDILSARRDIHEVLERGPGGILVVPGVWAPDHEIPFSQHAQLRLVRQIQSLGRHADLVLIDVGSASAETVQRFWQGADEGVLITTPDSVSVMDCYATLKAALAGGAAPDTLRLIVNQVQDPLQEIDVHRRIDQSARRFLQREIGLLGSVPLDPEVARSATRTVPVMLGAPACAAARAIETIAAALAAAPIHTIRTAA
ncbi:MAG: MinD/ParA family ATP-binding protein [Pirellulaceae bacterium]